MNKFKEWIYTEDVSKSWVADELGITLVHLSRVINETVPPSERLAFLIERLTKGFVPMDMWKLRKPIKKHATKRRKRS